MFLLQDDFLVKNKKRKKMYQPVVLLSLAGELDPHVRGRGNDVPPPPHPPASVE